jgi:hypothetical protein
MSISVMISIPWPRQTPYPFQQIVSLFEIRADRPAFSGSPLHTK